MRIISSSLVIFGTLLLLSILSVSHEAIPYLSQNTSDLEVLGNVLRSTRDNVNHVFMIIILCTSNIMLYILLIKSKFVPKWLSVWGIFGGVLSIVASFLVLFQVIEIITSLYIALNMPTALLEFTLGIWLIVKGFANEGLDN